MFELSEILQPECACCGIQVASKKRAIECLSELVAKVTGDISQNQIFESLIARERLGSTAIGHGVALPHGRIPHLPHPIAAILRLPEGVDVGAPDDQPVDILVALLVPENADDEHLQYLASLAKLLHEENFRHQLRQAKNDTALYHIATEYHVPAE